MQTAFNEYMEIVQTRNSLCIVLFSENIYVGNIMASSMNDKEIEDIGLATKFPIKKIIYVYSMVIEKEHQNKGYGTILFKEFLSMAKERGYWLAVGNYRNGTARHIAEKNGGMPILTINKDKETTLYAIELG